MEFLEIEKRRQTLSYNMTEAQFHEYYEIYFLTEGTRDFFIENKLYRITAPSVCIIPPFIMHKTEGEAYERINVYLSEKYLDKNDKYYFDKLGGATVFPLQKEQITFISSILNEAIEIGNKNFEHTKIAQLNFVKTVMYYLQTQALTPLHEVGFTKHGKHADESVLRIVSYLNENYREHITLNDLSARFFLSKNTLCARFKKQMNCSIINYLTFVRINKAKMYLSSTNLSMEKITELCGFPSANYFGLVFKKSCGLSPINYRKKK